MFIVGIITADKISPSTPTHSSIAPPCRRLPLELSRAAILSTKEPFLNTYLQ